MTFLHFKIFLFSSNLLVNFCISLIIKPLNLIYPRMQLRLSLLFLMLYCFVSTPTFAQFNSHWFFGDGYDLDFTGTPSITATNGAVLPNDTPSAISDEDGNLLFYSDNTAVYNQNGDQMLFGDLTLLRDNSIIIPAPPSMPDRYYLIKSSGSTGMDYSVIDMTMDDGLGAVVPLEKELTFGGNGGLLLSATKGDESGYWLLVLDNAAGQSDDLNITVYSVNEDGIEEHSFFSQYYLWAGWNSELDDAAISNDCSKIAASFKGHYFALFRFDADEGLVFDPLSGSVNNNGSFVDVTELEFSPNSEILYSVSNYNTLGQYQIESWNPNTISSTANTINVNSNLISDIKLGPDNKLYIFDESNGEIDRLNAPDLIGADADLENGVITEISGNLTLFPNLINPQCGIPAAAFQVIPQNLCLGDTAFFSLSGSNVPDSLSWNFGDPNLPEAGSNSFTPFYVYPEPGVYNVSTTVYQGESIIELSSEVNVFAYPEAELPEDLVLCSGETIEVSGGEALSYSWSTNENTESIVISSGGEYILTLANQACTDSDTLIVTLLNSDPVSLPESLTLCDEPSTVLETPDYFGGSWDNGSSDDLEVSNSGEYTYTVDNICNQSSATISVFFVNTPSELLPVSLSACIGDTISLSTGLEGYEHEWSASEGNASSIQFGDEGVVSVTVDYEGCPVYAATLVERIPFLDPNDLSFPNIFSPNSDAKNQSFRPYLKDDPGYPVCSHPSIETYLEVYNRWGSKVRDDACFWSGEIDTGEQASEGVYYYIMTISSTCKNKNEEIEVSGAVTLVR